MKPALTRLCTLLLTLSLLIWAAGTGLTYAYTVNGDQPATGKIAASPATGANDSKAIQAAPGQYLVKLKAGAAKGFYRDAAALGGRVLREIPQLNTVAVEFPAPKQAADPNQAAATIAGLLKNSNVEYVEPDYIYTASFTPND